jgi:prephenate dehydratase
LLYNFFISLFLVSSLSSMTTDIINRLQPHRDEIDRIDEEIIALLAKRQKEAEQIGVIKSDAGDQVLDPKRELEGRTKRRMKAKEQGIDPLMTEMVFEQIVLMARSRQENSRTVASRLPSQSHPLRVGVMGGIGSFSEAAALEFLEKSHRSDFELQYPISSENVLRDLENGRVDLGIFPIENSTAGMVIESIQAASRHAFEIVEIFDFDVIHCLMALPGVTKDQVTKVMSHPQALKQCKGYLADQFGSAELVEATDTAEGARVLSQSTDEKTLAVIAPERCAELYGLEVLEKAIQDLEVNFTRFIAAKRADSARDDTSHHRDDTSHHRDDTSHHRDDT